MRATTLRSRLGGGSTSVLGAFVATSLAACAGAPSAPPLASASASTVLGTTERARASATSGLDELRRRRLPLPDDATRAAVERGLMLAGIDRDEVEVTIDRGIVMLEGSVPDLLAARDAVRRAATIRGVRSVIDRLEVRAPVVGDDSLWHDVSVALVRSPVIPHEQVLARVDGGTVTLAGLVETGAMKRWIERTVAAVRGVRAIHDQIEVRYPEERADQEIATEVRRRVAMDRWLDASELEVEVHGGVVFAAGAVGSAGQLTRLRELAEVPGVRGVDLEHVRIETWESPPTRRSPAAPMPGDEAARAAILDGLRLDPRVGVSDVSVRVDDGVAKLAGEVQTIAARRAAEDVAWGTRGVWEVDDALRVAPAEVEDDALRASVEEALAQHAWLAQRAIDVEVHRGRVRLEGDAVSERARRTAIERAEAIPGVVAVVDRMHSAEPARPTGEALAEAIADQIFWDPTIDSDDLEVEVGGDTAILRGTVEDHGAYLAAVRSAYEAGAREVEAELRVLEREGGATPTRMRLPAPR